MSEHDQSLEVDCQEHRRRLLIDPRDDDPALARHRAVCAACARATREAMAFEAALGRALEAPLPADMRKRVEAAPRRRATRRLALAAGWLLSLGLAGWLGYGARERWAPEPDLARVVIEHIRAEAAHLHADDQIRVDQLVGLFNELGGELMADLGAVRFAGICVIRRGEGAHLVIKGRQGPVTLLFMPGEHLEAPLEVNAGRLRGRVVPTEYGSLAVVGERGEAVEALLHQARNNLHWRT